MEVDNASIFLENLELYFKAQKASHAQISCAPIGEELIVFHY